jgi:hypothetical protein
MMAMSLTVHVSRIFAEGQLTEFAELAIGNDERAKRSDAAEYFIAMLLGNVLLHRGRWQLGVLDVDLLRVPDELLEEISLVLGEE